MSPGTQLYYHFIVLKRIIHLSFSLKIQKCLSLINQSQVIWCANPTPPSLLQYISLRAFLHRKIR